MVPFILWYVVTRWSRSSLIGRYWWGGEPLFDLARLGAPRVCAIKGFLFDAPVLYCWEKLPPPPKRISIEESQMHNAAPMTAAPLKQRPQNGFWLRCPYHGNNPPCPPHTNHVFPLPPWASELRFIRRVLPMKKNSSRVPYQRLEVLSAVASLATSGC